MDTVDTRSASVPEDGEKIIEIQLERLRTFKNHPFKIRMDRSVYGSYTGISTTQNWKMDY